MSKASRQAEYRQAASRYFQAGATIEYDKPQNAPIEISLPAWLERLAAWLDNFVRFVP